MIWNVYMPDGVHGVPMHFKTDYLPSAFQLAFALSMQYDDRTVQVIEGDRVIGELRNGNRVEDGYDAYDRQQAASYG